MKRGGLNVEVKIEDDQEDSLKVRAKAVPSLPYEGDSMVVKCQREFISLEHVSLLYVIPIENEIMDQHLVAETESQWGLKVGDS